MNRTNNGFNSFINLNQFSSEGLFQSAPNFQDYNNIDISFFKKGGGIKIKEKNKGSFTKYCGGNVTSECIRRGKNSSNPKTRKKAIFAQNSRRWKHQNGGVLLNIDKLNKLLIDAAKYV